jgi:hypothetical protein
LVSRLFRSRFRVRPAVYDDGMATWEDGPEYAPLVRPALFDQPLVAPLAMAPPVQQMASLAPKVRPLFADPPVPVAPLATLIPPVAEVRDPQQPFDVVSSALTTDSGWGGVHWSPPTGTPVTAPLVAGSWPPPPAPPVAGSWPPPPDQPLATNSFPAPGTPEWFGPGPYGEQQQPTRVGPKAVLDAATPGLCICLVIGGLIYLVAPIMLGVAIGLSNRVKAAQPAVHRVFVAGGGLLALIAVLAALLNEGGFGDWWAVVGGWALAICWVSIMVTLILVQRALSSGSQPQPPYRSPWG